MKKLIILCLALPVLFAQELEVEGNLKVTGEIDAQGNPITNVGNPTQDADAVNLSTVRDMSGMKPERIYRKQFLGSGNYSPTYTVPAGKIWKVVGGPSEGGLLLYLSNDYYMYLINGGDVGGEAYFLPGDAFFFGDWAGVRALVNIFEYSIQSSGTEQGLDYVEP